MNKKLLVFVAFFAVIAAIATAQVQGTVGVDVMTWGGVRFNTQDAEADTGPVDLPGLPLPYGQLAYNFDFGLVDIGIGAKAYTIILLSAIYPIIYADFNLGPVVLHTGAGGLAFALLSPFGNTTQTGSVLIPEVGAYFKIGKAFQLGLSGLFFMSTESSFYMPYMIFVSGRFVFDLFGSSK